METKEYLVIGATGKTGRRVVSQLRGRGEVVREAGRTEEVRFDWEDPTNWQSALKGVYGVYLVAAGEAEPAERFIAEAQSAGVKRIVLLSSRGVGEGYLFEDSMLAAEEALKKSSLDWTILRPTNFNQNFDEDFWLPLVKSGRLALPIGDVPEPFIDVDDIAAVAVLALTEAGHESKTYDLSGPETLTFAEAAAQMAKASGQAIVFENLSPEAYVKELLEEGYPDFVADIFASLLEYMRTGKNSPVSDTVRQVLGREAIRFGDYARKAAATGVWK